jgi:hypothetical protein
MCGGHFEMVTGGNFSMSGINSGHHNLSTYEMALKLDNAEFVRYSGGHLMCGIINQLLLGLILFIKRQK